MTYKLILLLYSFIFLFSAAVTYTPATYNAKRSSSGNPDLSTILCTPFFTLRQLKSNYPDFTFQAQIRWSQAALSPPLALTCLATFTLPNQWPSQLSALVMSASIEGTVKGRRKEVPLILRPSSCTEDPVAPALWFLLLSRC